MTRIAVTGASGFVGQNVIRTLVSEGHDVRALVRTQGTAPAGAAEVVIGDFTLNPDWVEALEGQDVVICLAARVHVMHENAVDPLGEFRKINVEVNRQIANAAVQARVPSLVFISSIKVNGEATRPGNPFRASGPAAPQDAYGMSKYEAEVMLREIAEESGLDVVIIRSPLVYGPGVGGNFFRLLKLAQSGLPLPFGSLSNKRAIIAVENLADAVLAACTKELNGVTVLLVNDQESISTSQLLRKLAEYLGKSARLLPFPSAVLSGGLAIVGKKAEADRLLGTMEVEVSSDPPGYGWIPPYSTDEALERTARWFREGPGRPE